jgi:hypothetical protein
MMALHWTFFKGVPTDAQSLCHYVTLRGVCVSWFRLLQFLDLDFFAISGRAKISLDPPESTSQQP